MSILRSSITSLVLLTAITILGGSSVLGAPPVPFLDDNEPGIQYLFSGDPDTTESTDGVLDCAQDAERAGTGGVSGKLHNDFLNCDNWDFQPKDWGQASFLQGAFVLGHSPFSSDGGWLCDGNEGPGGGNPCVNSTVRVEVTAKNTRGEVGMDTSKDWVFSFEFTMSVAAGDTYGNDKLFSFTQANDSGDIVSLEGSGSEGGFFVNGVPGYYSLHSRRGVTPIPVPIMEGKVTVHYKAVNHKMDLWFDDELVVADFESRSGDTPEEYAISNIQTGGGGISFENSLYDNILVGVLADAGPCGPQGPGTSVPGDFNCDGIVDVADLGIVGANFNTTEVTYVDGDANLDGGVDVADLGILGANWSASQATGNTSALVPEPTTLSLIAMSVLLVGRRRCG